MRLRNDRRAERIREGEARNARWQALLPEQQIDELNRRGVRACRQRERIFRKYGVGAEGSGTRVATS